MRISKPLAYLATVFITSGSGVHAIDLDLTSDDSIKSAASTVAFNLMTYYTGNRTGDVPGNLPAPYYWWEAGAVFMTMVDYWYYTGDTSYVEETQAAIIHQAGTDYNFMPVNQTKTEGNDDQGFWGMAAMTAAETNFDNPPDGTPGWLAMAQAVFNLMVTRWDDSTCGGGLRWQIFSFNAGYTYKNTIANGCFFNIAARLARYTGNATYAEWATKIYDWETSVGYISNDFEVFDGAADTENCTVVDKVRYSYTQGIHLFGAAVMATLENSTTDTALWLKRAEGLETATDAFFKKGVMFEQACEDATSKPGGTCNQDMLTFKAYLSRWMAAAGQLVPTISDSVMEKLKTSAIAAAAQCSGGASGSVCGEHWTAGATYDGTFGVGQEMSALSVIQSNLIKTAAPLVTNATGGTSVGDPDAGNDGASNSDGTKDTPITTGDKAGAGILTTLVLALLCGGVGFMVVGS